ncbi:MAG: sugar transferase [Candidatus Doudnabacteria bacterium]
MKRSELIFNILSIPVDITSLLLAGVMSFYIRLNLETYFPVLFKPDLKEFVLNLLAVIPILLVIFAFAGLYNLRGTRKFSTEFSRIVAAITIALLLIVFIFFFDQTFFNSRLIILIAWLVSIIVLVLARYILKKIQVALLKRGFGLHNLVVVGATQNQHPMLEQIRNDKNFGYEIVAEISDNQNVLEQLDQIYQKNKFEELLQADPSAPAHLNAQLLQFARQKGLTFNYLPDIFDVQRNHLETLTIDGMPVISIKNTPLTGWGSVVKRIFDISLSLISLIITSPLFLVIALAIKIDSKGKVFYAAPRGGHKKDFTFYKFRTMYSHLSVGQEYGGEEAEKVRHELWKVNARGGESGAFLKIKDDPRVTRVGKILRKTKLDEIPQFFNVLRGDMSMVGPRAHVIDEVDRYRDQYRRIFSIKPGIFGLSQIAQITWPDLPFDEEIKLNTYYIENWSVWLDIQILAKSFYYIFFGKKNIADY